MPTKKKKPVKQTPNQKELSLIEDALQRAVQGDWPWEIIYDSKCPEVPASSAKEWMKAARSSNRQGNS